MNYAHATENDSNMNRTRLDIAVDAALYAAIGVALSMLGGLVLTMLHNPIAWIIAALLGVSAAFVRAWTWKTVLGFAGVVMILLTGGMLLVIGTSWVGPS